MTDYTIISIDNSREMYKRNIREQVEGTELFLSHINGHTADLPYEVSLRGLKVVYDSMFSNGEIGIWMSQFNIWTYISAHDKPLMVFEDDAIPTKRFHEMSLKYQAELPADYDTMALWVPENQRIDYLYDVDYGDDGLPKKSGPERPIDQSQFDCGLDYICKAYQGYGLVATLISPKGARTLMRLARDTGIYTPVDCFLYQEAHKGNVNAYAPKPQYAMAVSYDWEVPTTRNTEGRYLI